MVTTAAELMVLRAGSPLRPPGWVWAFARLYRSLPPACRIMPADPYVHKAIDFQHHMLDPSLSVPATAAALLAAGDAGDAYAFWAAAEAAALPPPKAPGGGPDDEDRPVPGSSGPCSPMALAKAEVEALILAGKSPATISKVSGLSPEAAVWFEKWFFDVRDRLRRPGWIAANVIGPLHYGTPAMLMPALIRAYGYYTKSARVVRTVTSTFDGPASRIAAKTPATFFKADAESASGIKAALAARLLPLNAKTYARVIELHHEALDVAARTTTDSGAESESKYRDALNELSGRISFDYNQPPTNLAETRLPRLVTDEAVS